MYFFVLVHHTGGDAFFFNHILFGGVGSGVMFRDAPNAALVTNWPIFTHIFTCMLGHLFVSFILLRNDSLLLVPAFPCLI